MTGPATSRPSPIGESPSHPAPTTVSELRDQIAAVAQSRTPVRIVGLGQWMDAGRPVLASARLRLHRITGIIEYEPGDFTITAYAGTPLTVLQSAVAAHGQWLPLEPWGGDSGSLGATLATATTGPSGGQFSLPRDVVLGVQFVSGDARVVRGGGRVVKNVAGFDLTRLAIGAWGTLGVITEATVRLRAIPEAEQTLALCPSTGVAAWGAAVRRLDPAAAELVNGTLAERLGLGSDPLLLVRLAGSAALVTEQRLALAAIGDVAVLASEAWTALRTIEPARSAVMRYSDRPSRLAALWDASGRVAESIPNTLLHASVRRGVVRVIMPSDDEDVIARAIETHTPAGATRIAERLPEALWPRLAPSPVSDHLSRGVRRAFDPFGLLNPGILGDEPR